VRQRLARQGKKNFLMFGEAFDGNDALVGSVHQDYYHHWTPDKTETAEALARDAECGADGPPLTGDQLDSVFYFPQHYQAFRDVFRRGASRPSASPTCGPLAPPTYGTEAARGRPACPPTRSLVNFIDNHDVARFLYWAAEQADKRAPARPPAQRAAPAVHRRGHPLPLLRHRARVPRRQRPFQPRGHVGHLLPRHHRPASTPPARPSSGRSA
jgi:hypothetical protein